ncbi:MAG: flippase [Hyphomicrobiaceae bacterium]|nr:flippase [Hyphomicrobiaceae bacterium]
MPSPSQLWAAISKSATLQTFGKNSIVQAGEQLVNIIFGLAITIYLARQWGPSIFGVWSICLALLRIAMTCLSYGLDTIILRHCSQQQAPDEKFLTGVIVLRAVNAALILGAALVGIHLLPAEDRTLANLTLVMMSALLVLPFEGLEFWFRATKDAVAPALARSISVIAGSLLKAALVASGAAIIYVGAAHAFQIGLFGLILLAVYLWRGHRFRFDTSVLGQIGGLYRDAWPLFITTLGYLVYARIDIMMLAWLRGDHAAGTYAATVRISEVFDLAPVILLTAASPFLFNGMRNNVKKFSGLFQVFLTYLNLLFFAGALAVCLLSSFLVWLLFGSSYSESAGFLSIHIFGIVFIAQGVATQYWWVARRRQRVVMWRALAGGVLNVILNLLLIPDYGGYGAAIATVISQFFSCVGMNVFLGRNGWYLLRMQLVPKFRLNKGLNLDELVGTPPKTLISDGARAQ